MLQLRRSEDRGVGEHGGWLTSRHSFSFANYYDPQFMGFSALRVINDDVVAPGAGFPKHGHRDMEIISVVLQGSIEHQDSMGHVSRLCAGEVQRMSAGTGVTHSEYNPSADEPLRFLQIWIEPERQGLAPSYEQRAIAEQTQEKLTLLASPADEDDGAMQLHQNARLYFGRLTSEESLTQLLDLKRKYYLHVITGDLNVNQQAISAGDALAISEESELKLESTTNSEFLWFDLP
jgi:redox-sensitive bicupin YhaK (pirin superfamily)